jgi:NodT family efflux transporter outer membrane factor (OMF) lipoprotein
LTVKHRAHVPAILCAALLAGCALAPAPDREQLQREAMPHVAVPPQWAAGGRGDPVAEAWLAAFRDPALDALITEALAYNTDLRVAATRVDTAAAYVRAADSALWPQVNLLGRGGGKMSGDGSGLSGVGLVAGWELDLWGRVRATTKAAGLQYDSAALDAAYARQSIAALVAKAWILAIEARLQLGQAQAMVKDADHLTALARDRLNVGSGSEYDVAVAQASAESFRDAGRNLELAYQNALRALETLVGRYPATQVAVASALPAWPGDVPAGLPSALLERRPDVVAAERRVAAAFYRVEEAKAARLPRISLSASLTSISSDLFVLQERNNPLFSIGASLLQPVFLGGLLQAQVEARTAEQQTAIAEYGRIAQRVFGEVEGALAAGATAVQREEILQRAVRDNARALELAEIRYRVGAGDLRAVAQQRLALQAAQVTLLRMQAERLVQRVNLHLALGGSFDAVPAVASAVPDPAASGRGN